MKDRKSNIRYDGNLELDALAAMDEKALEALADSSDINVPEGLMENTERLIDCLDASGKILADNKPAPKIHLVSNTSRHLWTRISAAAACVAIGTILFLSRPTSPDSSVPQDTFADPALAYAEIERVLGNIAEKTSAAGRSMAEAEYTLEKQISIFKTL